VRSHTTASPVQGENMPQSDLTIAPELQRFIEEEVLPGLDIPADQLWSGLAGLLQDFTPKNRALLEKRDQYPAPDRHLAP